MSVKTLHDDLLVGVDVGTQSVKVVVYDHTKKSEVTTASAGLDLVMRDDGTREQEASWWLDALRSCFSKIPREVRDRIMAVAVSGQQHGFVPLGEGGRVLAPVKLWNDTSTVRECRDIEEALGGTEEVIKLAGNPILPGYTASKVLWLKRNRPSAYMDLRHILLPHDYINFYLTGRIVTEAGDASGTAFFDIRSRQWSKPILAAIDRDRDLSSLLPHIVEPDEVVGILLPNVAAELGLRSTVIVAPGGGDNMMAAIGTGAVLPGALTVSLGTSGTLYGYSTAPAVADNGEFAAFCSSTGGYLPLVCSLNCTSATEVARNMLGVSLADFDTTLRQSAPGSDGVIALPFFSGERTPNCPHGTGSFFGLTPLNTSKANLLRSVVEAATFALRLGLESMQKQGLVAKVAAVTGGGAHSEEWRQIVADSLNVTVFRPRFDEAAAFGAALQALWCIKRVEDKGIGIADVITSHLGSAEDSRVLPTMATTQRYNEVYRRYHELVIMMQKQWAALT